MKALRDDRIEAGAKNGSGENRVPYHINKEKSTTQVTIKLSTTSLVAAKDS